MSWSSLRSRRLRRRRRRRTQRGDRRRRRRAPTVYAAASLTEVFPTIDPAPVQLRRLGRARDADPRGRTGGRLRGGELEVSAGALRRGARRGARHVRLQPARPDRPTDNPAGIEEIARRRPSRASKLVVAAEGVPVGDYTRRSSTTLGLRPRSTTSSRTRTTSRASSARSRSARRTQDSSTRPTPPRGRRRHGRSSSRRARSRRSSTRSPSSRPRTQGRRRAFVNALTPSGRAAARGRRLRAAVAPRICDSPTRARPDGYSRGARGRQDDVSRSIGRSA